MKLCGLSQSLLPSSTRHKSDRTKTEEALPKSQALNRTPEDEISDTPSGRILNASEAAADAEELSEAEKLRDD